MPGVVLLNERIGYPAVALVANRVFPSYVIFAFAFTLLALELVVIIWSATE